jgi:hypothetical protein
MATGRIIVGSNKLTEAVRFLTCTAEFPGSTLSQDIEYPMFQCFSSVPPGKSRDSTLH